MTKDEFTMFEHMCRWGDCEREGQCTIMGVLYCNQHMQSADEMWERAYQSGGKE